MSQNLFSEQQIEDYHTEGYLVVPRLFGEEELALVDRTVRQLTAEALASGNYADKMELEPESIGADEPVVRRLYEPFRQHENFRQLATDPRIVNRLTGLIGPDIHLQHSKLNMKPAKVGSVVEWHQDLAYFPHSNDDLVSLLIYLDDATEENGCLQVLPRHHHHFFDHRLSDGSFAGMITETVGSKCGGAVRWRRLWNQASAAMITARAMPSVFHEVEELDTHAVVQTRGGITVRRSDRQARRRHQRLAIRSG